VSVCIDRGLGALLWPGPILLIRRPWPYVIHHLHFMNMYRLYIAWFRPILLMYVGCINWCFRNKTLFLWLKRPYFHFTDTGVYYPLLNIMVDTTRVQVQVSLQCLHCQKRVLLRKHQLIQPTYISNIGLNHAMYSRYMFMKCKWWMTYGQGRLVSNIGPDQSSAPRPLSIHTLTEIKL
jgi:hypothetical protein